MPLAAAETSRRAAAADTASDSSLTSTAFFFDLFAPTTRGVVALSAFFGAFLSAARTWLVTAATGSARNCGCESTARMRPVSASTSLTRALSRRIFALARLAEVWSVAMAPSVASSAARFMDAAESAPFRRFAAPGDFILVAAATRIFSRNLARFVTLRFWCVGSASRAFAGWREREARGERVERRAGDSRGWDERRDDGTPTTRGISRQRRPRGGHTFSTTFDASSGGDAFSVAACFPTATFPRIRCFTMVAVTHEQSARAKRVAGRAAAE